MRVGVFGAGGVGGYFGGKLAQSGEEVLFIARRFAALDAARSHRWATVRAIRSKWCCCSPGS
ncbi:MAG: 2-dehydropantoate 2-reductase N-terminal domain-containing protein [Anaerolineales bacterium]